MPSGPSERTLKVLFAQSRNRCAAPGCEQPVIAPATSFDSAAPVAQIAHIVARSAAGPRGDPSFPSDQLHDESNLILLCGHHHALVDAQCSTFTVDELRRWKQGVVESHDERVAIEEELDHAQALLLRGDYEAAVLRAEEVVSRASAIDDTAREQEARYVVLRATLLGAAFGSTTSGAGAKSRMEHHLEALVTTGASPTRVALEQAYAAQLGDDAELELRLALEALSLARAEEDAASVAGALVACLHAYGRVGRPGESSILEDEVEQALASSDDGELHLPLAAAWLQALRKLERISVSDVDGFGVLVRGVVQQGRMDSRRIAEIVGQVAGDLYEAGHLPASVVLLGLQYEVLAGSESVWAAHAAMQGAEVAAQAGDVERAHGFLGMAASAVEQTKDRPGGGPQEGSGAWPTLRARFLFARAKTLHRLAGNATIGGRLKSYQRTYDAFLETWEFATANRAVIQGDIELFLADVNWGLGKAARELGRTEEAASFFEAVHSDAGMAHPEFSLQVAIPAWLLEAEDRMWSGQLDESRRVASELLVEARVPQDAIDRATALVAHIDNVLLPTREWFYSAEALEISEIAKRDGVREAVRQQADRLISWWGEWHDDDGAMSVLLDFWGRGGFARVATAIRARPDSAIVVDAISIDEIRRWARILCPLFDTVVVKWKGDLGHGLCTCPLKPEYGGPGAFGGHGYTRAADMIRDDWGVALGWANPIPRPVVSFLAGEAGPLVAAGRLLVLPAALVGCAQTAVGWTDQLLTDGLLGGVVQGIGGTAENRTGRQHRRVLDLVTHSLPYIDHVSLRDLAMALEEIQEWVRPLRSLLLRSLQGPDLRIENWMAIGALEIDIQDACAYLKDRLGRLASANDWGGVSSTGGDIAAGEQPDDRPGTEPMADLLRSITGERRDLAPWVPFWRLQGLGGYLDWSGPLDNPSTPPNSPMMPSEVQTWLYPGTGGYGVIGVVVFTDPTPR